MNAFNQVGTFTPDNLIAGNQVPLLTKAIKLEVGEGTLKRGSIISATGTLANVTTTDIDGILTDDVVLDNGNTADGTIYITGEFKSACLTTAEDTTPSNFERELRILGIYI